MRRTKRNVSQSQCWGAAHFAGLARHDMTNNETYEAFTAFVQSDDRKTFTTLLQAMWPNLQYPTSAIPSSPSTECACHGPSGHAYYLRRPGYQYAAFQQRQRCHQHHLTAHLQPDRSRRLSQEGIRLQSTLRCCKALAGTTVGEQLTI